MQSDTITPRWRKLVIAVPSLSLALIVATSIGCRRARTPNHGGATLQEENTNAQRQPDKDDQARFARLVATAPTLTIEIVEPGKFKIDGKGPFTADEARAEAVRVATGKQQILVHLTSSREAIADDEYKAFKKSLHNDGGMLVGLEISGLGEKRRP